MKHLTDHPLLMGIENVDVYPFAQSRELYDITPPPMLIEDFLPRAGVMGITAFPGVGKSWLTLEIIRSIARGKRFLNKFNTTEGSCLFVGSDSSIFDYARQWTRLVRSEEEEWRNTFEQSMEEDVSEEEHDARMEASFGPDHRLGPFHNVRFLMQSSFMFENVDEVRRLIATHNAFRWGPAEEVQDDVGDFAGVDRTHGFDAIVFDTLSRLTRANQNDNTEMEEVFRNIRLIAEATGAALVLLHHNSKRTEFNDGADWRGAMSQIGALDSWVQLSPSRKDKYLIGCEFKKFRGITPANFTYRMEVNDPARASLTTTNETVFITTDAVSDAIYDVLIEHRGNKFSITQLTEALYPALSDVFGGNKKKCSMAIRNRARTLVNEKREGKETIHCEGGGSRAVRVFYFIPKDTNETVPVQQPDEAGSSAVPVVPGKQPKSKKGKKGNGPRTKPA